MLSDLVPFEAIELLVAKVYTNTELLLDSPGTLLSGFMRFLKLLASQDWARCVGHCFGCHSYSVFLSDSNLVVLLLSWIVCFVAGNP